MISEHLAEMRSIIKEVRERFSHLYYPMTSVRYEMDDKILGYVDANHIGGVLTDADDALTEVMLVLSMNLDAVVEREERLEDRSKIIV